MKLLAIALSMLVLLAGCAPAAVAQAPGTAEPRVDWYRATYFRYKSDRLTQARQLVREHFWPVDRVLRPELIVFEFETGGWHQVAYFPLHEGPGEMAGSEKDAQWMTLLSERSGGRERAERLLAEWREMIAESKTELVRRPVLW